MKNIAFLKQSLIAHRGYHNINKGIPENSILSFEEAIKRQLIIELDVHILKDGNVVVFHDDNIKRMTGIDQNIKEMNYNEIKEVRLQNTNQKIPLFKDVLKIVNGKVPVIIELKNDVRYGVLEKEVINILHNYKGKYAVKSFNPFSIRYIKKHSPNIIRGLIISTNKRKKASKLKRLFLNTMLLNYIADPDFISCNIKLLPNNNIKKLRMNKLILGWTIRSEKDLEFAQKYCDNFICENIDKKMLLIN